MEGLQVFNYLANDVRVVMENGEPWFVAKDVCDVLEHSDTSKAVSRLDDDEKLTRTLFVSGQNRDVWLINEPGLYDLILTSRKSEAKRFKRWVKHDVLPSIRKTGSYSAQPKTSTELIALLAETNVQQEKRLSAVEEKVGEVDKKLNERMTLDYYQQSSLLNAKNKRVEKLWNTEGEYLGACDTRKKLHAAAWRDIRRVFGVASYKDVRQKHFEEALRYVEAWRPAIV